MKQLEVRVKHIKEIKRGVFLVSFSSSFLSRNCKPGEFIHIKIDSAGILLRRPFSVHRIENDDIYILFKVRGRGTKKFSEYKKGDKINIIGPLGKSFDYMETKKSKKFSDKENGMPVLIGGGIGVAPLVFLAQKISKIRGKKPSGLVFLGARDKNEILCKDYLNKLDFRVFISTEDGSMGKKGTAIDLFKDEAEKRGRSFTAAVYSCGPKDMFRELANTVKYFPNINVQVSFEQFMGCGIGVCRACVIDTKSGLKRVCKDGPVFDLKDIY